MGRSFDYSNRLFNPLVGLVSGIQVHGGVPVTMHAILVCGGYYRVSWQPTPVATID